MLIEGESRAMIRSMTGFGRKQAPWQDGSVTVEVRSVNHRFLEVACRLPRALAALEDLFKKAVQQRCSRGRIDMTVMIQGGKGRAGSVNLDQALAKQYHQVLRTLKHSLKLTGSIDVALIAGLRDVVSVSDQPPEDPKLAKLVHKLATLAIDDLHNMRLKEGVALAKDMQGRIQSMKDHRSAVASRSPKVVQETFERMKQRIEKLLGTEPPDIPRLHQELALYADRGDITEEIVRLDSHMIQFEQQLNRAESVGKTLDFLLQEMGREINTIGSKANDAEIAAHVIQMKAELERIREQVQNVE
ncbi:MAG TPA: YicC/YloC family endoribonuclease, partial [Nitrospira sp.]|nr:YicC/YloC family endoribonuclease [Nitrospira sp.]